MNLQFLMISFLASLVLSCSKETTNLDCLPFGLRDHVIAFYPFSNGSLDDFSGNGFSLVNPNDIATSIDRDGNNACAYAFQGSSEQYLSRNGRFLDNFHKKPFSVSLWYKPIGDRDLGEYEFICGRISKKEVEVPNSFIEWAIALYDCRRAEFKLNRSSKWDNFHPIWDDTTITDNQCALEFAALSDVWHHLVVTFDGDEKHLYRNTISSTTVDDGFRFGTMSRNLGDFFIGRGFQGNIDDIIIFDKVISQDEVNQLFNLESCCQ